MSIAAKFIKMTKTSLHADGVSAERGVNVSYISHFFHQIKVREYKSFIDKNKMYRKCKDDDWRMVMCINSRTIEIPSSVFQ